MSLHSKDVEPGDLLTSMDTSLVVECLLFSVQIVWCLVKAISESAKPHETSRMVWSFGGLGNKNPKKFWRHGKREEVGFMWTRMLLGCISTSISQQSSQQCVTLERFEVSKRKELLAVQVGWSFKRKSDEKTGNCPYWMGKPQSAFEARSQCKPNSIKSHETIQMSQFYVFHAIQLAIGAICGLYFATSSQGFVNLCVADPSTGGFVCIPGPEQLQQCFLDLCTCWWWSFLCIFVLTSQFMHKSFEVLSDTSISQHLIWEEAMCLHSKSRFAKVLGEHSVCENKVWSKLILQFISSLFWLQSPCIFIAVIPKII